MNLRTESNTALTEPPLLPDQRGGGAARSGAAAAQAQGARTAQAKVGGVPRPGGQAQVEALLCVRGECNCGKGRRRPSRGAAIKYVRIGVGERVMEKREK